VPRAPLLHAQGRLSPANRLAQQGVIPRAFWPEESRALHHAVEGWQLSYPINNYSIAAALRAAAQSTC
jgi:hypothetical protein